MADLNRRDALRLALGMGDRIALEREQQSAIDAVRGDSTSPPAEDATPAEAVPAPARPTFFARLRGLIPFLRKS